MPRKNSFGPISLKTKIYIATGIIIVSISLILYFAFKKDPFEEKLN